MVSRNGVFRICPSCGRTINLSESGFCTNTRCLQNYYTTYEGRRELQGPQILAKRETWIRRKMDNFKSIMVKIFKW